ncbi:MAG: hypothetical protein GY795_03630 [Desulfobacterales bacterium]|nr:hypothetical protein [Desulfobacterales bacterium]
MKETLKVLETFKVLCSFHASFVTAESAGFSPCGMCKP